MTRRTCCGIIAMVCGMNAVYVRVKRTLSRGFQAYGTAVGRHPVVCSLAPLVVLSLLGLGILRLQKETDTELLYTPVGSRIFRERERMKELFPDSTGYNFNAFGLVDVPTMAVVIFRYASTDPSLFSNSYDAGKARPPSRLFLPQHVRQMRHVDRAVRELNVTHNGTEYGFADLCALSAAGQCVVDGDLLLADSFLRALDAGRVTFPELHTQFGRVDLTWVMTGVDAPHNQLLAASVIKLRYYLRVDRRPAALEWNNKFLKLMENMSLGDGLEMVYSSSESLEQELERGTSGDIVYFGLTILLMVAYSVLVTTGGDAVSTRAMLACGGVLAAGLSIIGAFGLLCLMGIKYVNFVGVVPFLVIGIGVDDMFLLMSAWGETIHMQDLSVPERVGITFSKAGVGITITSITDFLAFLIGITSDFIVVRQFCIYTGVAVILCYICNATLFGACLALHGQRVYSNRHCFTFRPAQTREQLQEQGASRLKVFCCGGSIPAKNWEDESACEKLPRRLLPRVILNPVVKVILVIAFFVYLGCSLWGAVFLEQGMVYKNLVLDSSYYHRFSSWDMEYFGQRLAIAFVVDGTINYAGAQGDAFLKVLRVAQQDPGVNSTFIRCWLDEYRNASYYDATSSETFMKNLSSLYLPENRIMQTDVVLDPSNMTIVASRCYLLTLNLVNPFKQAQLMARLRTLADGWKDVPVFIFQPLFVMLEHTIAILPSTLQTLGTAVAVMFFVTMAFLPQPFMVVLVTLNILLILTGVFGSMYFLGITYNGIAMVHLIMSVGFSVDFSAHICAAYLMSDAPTRKERAEYAIVHASGPIFNGGMSSLVGVAMLLMSESYIFSTFFKIMGVVITAGAVHAVFFMPVLLSYIGPEDRAQQDKSGCDGHTSSGLKKTDAVVSNGVHSSMIPAGAEHADDRDLSGSAISFSKLDSAVIENCGQVENDVPHLRWKNHISLNSLVAAEESCHLRGNMDDSLSGWNGSPDTDGWLRQAMKIGSGEQPQQVKLTEPMVNNLSAAGQLHSSQACTQQTQLQEAASEQDNLSTHLKERTLDLEHNEINGC